MAFDLPKEYLTEWKLGWGREKAGVCVGGVLRVGEGLKKTEPVERYRSNNPALERRKWSGGGAQTFGH